MIRKTQSSLPRLFPNFQTPYPYPYSSSTKRLQQQHIHKLPPSIKCITFISKRFYASFNYSKAPTKLFMATFLGHRYRQVNNWIFEDNNIETIGKNAGIKPPAEGSKEDFINLLRWNSEFEQEQIIAIIDVYDRLIEVLYEMRNGFEFLQEFWDALFNNTIESSESRLNLQKLILERRSKLIEVLIHTGRYDLYEKLIKPQLLTSKNQGKLDEIIQVIQPHIIKNDIIIYNSQLIEEYLLNPKKDITMKRDIIKWVVKTVLNPINAITYEKNSYEQRMQYTKQFITWSNLVENGDEWFVNSRNGTPYDDILPLIGVYNGRINVEVFLQDLVRVVSREYGMKNSYYFITAIMRTIIKKSPYLTYQYFTFKESQIRLRSLPRNEVLFVDDLTLALKACFKFDIEKIHELYRNNKDLHDGNEGHQETVLLELCRKLKDWNTLQKRFESMYGKGDLPLTVHYGIVMQSLDALKADDEMQRLFDQLDWRKLKLSATVMASLMRAKSRIHDQDKVVELFEDYIIKAKTGKADPEGVQNLFPLVIELLIHEKKIDSILECIETYLEREKDEEFTIVNGDTLNKVFHSFLDSYSLKSIEKLRSLVESYNKESTEYYSGLISVYSKLDLFEKAEATSYEAHGKSKIPFSDMEIWAQQLKNYINWLKRCPDRDTELYLYKKITFIARNALETNEHVFNSEGGVSIICDLMTYYNYIKTPRIPGRLFQKAKLADLKSEKLYLQQLRTLVENLRFSKVISVFQRMNERKIHMTARTYEIVVEAVLNLDRRSGNAYQTTPRSFKNSTSLIYQIQGYYGLLNERERIDELNLADDVVYLARMIVNYLSVVGPEKGAKVFLDFVRNIYLKLGKNISFKLHCIFFEGLRQVSNVSEVALSKELQKTKSLIDKYVEESPIDNPSLPYDLADTCGKLLFEKFEILDEQEDYESIDELKILDYMSLGVKFSNDEYITLFTYFLRYPDFRNLNQVLAIIEKYLIQGSVDQSKFYMEKKLCYKLCLNHLANTYKGQEQGIMDTYKVLNDYYYIQSLDEVKKDINNSTIKDFLRSPSGRLFNVSSDQYHSRTMNQHKFLEYFNPQRIPQKFISLTPLLRDLLFDVLQEYRNQHPKEFKSLRDKCPKTIDFTLNETNREIIYLLQNFEDIVNEYILHQTSKYLDANNYLKRTLLDSKYQLYIGKPTTQESSSTTQEDEEEEF